MFSPQSSILRESRRHILYTVSETDTSDQEATFLSEECSNLQDVSSFTSAKNGDSLVLSMEDLVENPSFVEMKGARGRTVNPLNEDAEVGSNVGPTFSEKDGVAPMTDLVTSFLEGKPVDADSQKQVGMKRTSSEREVSLNDGPQMLVLTPEDFGNSNQSQDSSSRAEDIALKKSRDIAETIGVILAHTEEAVAAAEASFSSQDEKRMGSEAGSGSLEGKGQTLTLSPKPLETDLVTINKKSSRKPKLVTASSVVGELPMKKNVAETKISSPSSIKILKFALPAIGVWLCGPLLSLIDTSSVGVLSGTTQQAALNPAVAVTDYAALLIAFLYTATTNLIAAAREQDRDVVSQDKTIATFVGSLQFSMYVGAGLCAVLMGFARVLVRTMVGNDSISPDVVDAAVRYVRIRALGMPAAAVIGSAQAACIGLQDIRSPLYVLVAAAAVNLVGDIIFVPAPHRWVGGAGGAALATVVSQFAALGLFLHWLRSKPDCKSNEEARHESPAKIMNLSNAILELTGKQSSHASRQRRARFRNAVVQLGRRGFKREITDESPELMGKAKKENKGKVEEDKFSVRGFLKCRFQPRDLLRLPSKATIDQFSPYILPVTSTQVGRVSGYVAMSHVVSSSLGTACMAAQQVIVSLFYCLTPIADSLSLTAQSFVPSIAEKHVSSERAGALRVFAKNLLKVAGVFGVAMVSAVAAIPFFSGFFTTDPTVVAMVNSVIPLLMGVFSVHSLVCALEGLLLGQKDLGFLGKMYAGFFAVVPYFMFRVKRTALSGAGKVGLTSVWTVFLGYQLFRAASWTFRAALLQHRTEKEVKSLSQTVPTHVD